MEIENKGNQHTFNKKQRRKIFRAFCVSNWNYFDFRTGKSWNYYSLEKINNLPTEKIFEKLGHMNNQEIRILLKISTPQKIDQVILYLANKIWKTAETLDSKDYRKLRAYHQFPQIRRSLEIQFSDLFQSIDIIHRQEQLQEKFKNKLSTLEPRIKRSIRAILQTQEEADSLKNQIQEHLASFKKEISESKIKEEQKVLLLNEINGISTDLLDFVDLKLKEDPVQLYYCKIGNRVTVKANIHKSSFACRTGTKRSIRLNQGNDREEYPLLISPLIIEEFLDLNHIRCEDAWVSENSVDAFYGFNGNHLSVNLTPAFVDKWWNFDCPDLIRYEPNKGQKYANSFTGQPFVQFDPIIIHSSFSYDQIDDTATEEELDRLVAGREETRLYQSAQNFFQAKGLAKEQEEIEKIRKEIADYDRSIQNVIDKNRYKILAHLVERFSSRIRFKGDSYFQDSIPPEALDTMKINDNFGFDCGFCDIYTQDHQYTKNRELLHRIKPSKFTTSMNLEMPYFSQSITVMSEQFNKVQEIVQKEAGIKLYAQMVYD